MSHDKDASVTITVDTFSTTKCGAYELSAAVLP